MAFFQDIADKFGQLGALAKQTYKTAQAKKTARETEAKLQEKKAAPSPIKPAIPTLPQIDQTLRANVPQFVKPQADFGLIPKEIKENITTPMLKTIPILGKRFTETPEQTKAREEFYTEKAKDYSFKDLGKDISNLGLNMTVNPLSRIGMTVTGEQTQAGEGFGFKDAKSFPPEVIGSYAQIFEDNKRNGDSPVVAGLRTAVTVGFDALLAGSLAKEGLPAARIAARELPESILFKIKTDNVPVEEILDRKSVV